MSEQVGGAEMERLRRRLDRERTARREAEAIAERVTSELYANVQQLKALNEQVERANLDLEAANQTMRDFVAVAAHDLRGPVAAILGFAQLMNLQWDQISEEEKREFITTIERRTRFLTRMLDNLLTVSRIEAGALEVHLETLEAADVIREALEEIGEERAAQVEVICPEGLQLVADADHVHRILVNYATNAFKYGQLPVVIEARDTGSFVEFVVRDHGEGIPSEFADRLFHKFARADTEATRKEKGTGLGLSIVQGLAEANDGEAWYEANEPRGSAFGVRLRRAAA